MSNLSKLQNEDARKDEASLWIARLDRGLSDDERRALDDWLKQSPRNRKLLNEMAEVWDQMDALSRLAEIFPLKSRSFFRWQNLALAASVLIVVSIGLYATLVQNTPVSAPSVVVTAVPFVPMEDRFETSVGEHSTVSLPDGSIVTLNTDSRIDVQYSPEERLIVLRHGELHVDVFHDPGRPLKVIAGRSVVRAVGTAFAINMTGLKPAELVVTDGTVEVTFQDQPSTGSPGSVGEVLPKVAVREGNALVLDDPQSKISRVNDEEMAVRLAWREGNLIFRGEPLSEAVKEISRYTAVNFVFNDESSRHVRVAGRFKVGDIDGLLAALQENFQIDNQRFDDKTILLSTRRIN